MWDKSPEELRQALAAPFASGDIEWRVSATAKDKTQGLAVPYVTNRAIQNRLDDTVGVDGWYNEFTPWKNGTAQLCGISIYLNAHNLWLTKWDGADDSDIEAVKGGLSDSMKRSAVEWGIGRYLYGMTQLWVPIQACGRGFMISDSARPKLDQAHERWVQQLQERRHGTGQAPQNSEQRPQAKASAQNHAQNTPPHSQTDGAPNALSEGCYLVCGAVLKPTLSGSNRTNVQLQDSRGQRFQAYTRGSDPRLAPGVVLTNVEIGSQSRDGVTFYILERYELVPHSGTPAA